MTEKLYRLKPFEWVQVNPRLMVLRDSPYEVHEFGNLGYSSYYLREAYHVFYILQDAPLEKAKARAEELWTERLLAALEEVPPPEPQGPIRP